MKKNILLSLFTLLNGLLAYSQTAVNFIGTDCAGNPHNLYSEMDAGKVIVVSFVMPCGSCIGPSNSAQTVAQSYAVSHPGRVLFYIADDDGMTSCPTLTSWVSSYISNTPNAVFSNGAFSQGDYPVSPFAMPKVVVIAGSGHQVLFHQDNTLTSTALQTAINSALASTAVSQFKSDELNLSAFPNPAKDNITLSYSLPATSDVAIDIYNIIGAKVITWSERNQASGNHSKEFNFENQLSNGIYFARINAEGSTVTLKFVVDK